MPGRALALGLALVIAGMPGEATAQIAPAAASPVDGVAGLREGLRRADSTAVLVTAQLRARDARVIATADAVRRGVRGTLVVMLRADASATSAVASATLSVDEAEITTRTYNAAMRQALAAGGADELYRIGQLALPHTISLRVARDGRPVTRTVTVTPPSDDGTIYVGFVVGRDGIDVDSWTIGPALAEP